MAGNGYKVTQVDSVTVLDSARNPKPGVQLFFSWGDGRSSNIRVMSSRFDNLDDAATAALRDELVRAEIAKIDAMYG